MKFIFTLFVLMSFSSISEETLKPFKSDGCSAFPNGTFQQKKLWLTCCEKHDFEYWKGGTYKQRFDSDLQLKHCVTQVGKPHIAMLMLAGVRVGGTPYLPTKFRWGYGWPYPKMYGELTVEELKQVATLSQLIHKTHIN